MARQTARLSLSVYLIASMTALAMGPSPVQAQMGMSRTGRSLGGYGASTISSYYSNATGGYLPSGGGNGFLPYRGGRNAGVGTLPVARRVFEITIGGAMMPATPIGGASLGGSIFGGSRGGMSASVRWSDRAIVPFGYEGGIGMSAVPMSAMSWRQGLAGPGIGYPFWMPVVGASAGMAMP